MPLVTAEHAIERIRQGEFVIVVDDEAEQNAGDLILAAEFGDADKINTMMQRARGTMCVAVTVECVERLNLTPMSPDGWSGGPAAFAASVDARSGLQAGDTAQGRAGTVEVLTDPEAGPEDLVRPGHVIPIRAVAGGVLRRVGHTEAAVDLARLAGLKPAGVLAQILRDDGSAATVPELMAMGEELGIAVGSIAGLIEYRRRTERLVTRQAEASLPTRWGEFKAVIYTSQVDGTDYVAVIKGDPSSVEAPPVRVHSGCLTGDVLGSLKCDCGWQLHAALERIEQEGVGVVLYIASHEGRGIGLANKIQAYHLQENGYDTVEANEALGFPADIREYGIGAQVLADLGITKMRLMTNNPGKYAAMQAYGLEVVERLPLEAPENRNYEHYLQTKRDKLGHLIRGQSEGESPPEDAPSPVQRGEDREGT